MPMLSNKPGISVTVPFVELIVSLPFRLRFQVLFRGRLRQP